MKKDMYGGKWTETRALFKKWWVYLTDDELEKTGGNADQIINLLQQRYGYTLKRAEAEFNRRLKEINQAVAED